MLIESKRLKSALLVALADIDMQKILDAVMHQSKSANQIVQETGLPHTTAYRKIKWLVEEGLLIVDKIKVTEEGKKSSFFRTVLKSFNVKYEYNSVLIEAEQNIDTLKRITQRFFSLDQSNNTTEAEKKER
jgi:predicted transcriptional regulator